MYFTAYLKDGHQKVEVKLKSTCQIHRNLHGYEHMNFEIARSDKREFHIVCIFTCIRAVCSPQGAPESPNLVALFDEKTRENWLMLLILAEKTRKPICSF